MKEIYFLTGIIIGWLISELLPVLRVREFKKDLMSSKVARKIIEDIKHGEE